MKGWQRVKLQELFEYSVAYLDSINDKQPWDIRAFLSEIPDILGEVLENQDKRCQGLLTVNSVNRRCFARLEDGKCKIHS